MHQSEFGERQDVVACAVFLHVLAHTLVEHLPVFCQVHVDEVNNDDTSHVAKTQLTCQFVSSTEIYFERIALLSFLCANTVTAVHVHHVHCLCVLDNEIGTMLVVHRPAEA